MKKIFDDYYLGLDMGTDSLGFAVTDTDYELLKFNGKRMWGTRLFDSGKTAEERRLFRTSRRRTARKKERRNLLQDIFIKEISKVDNEFFLRLNSSQYYPEDKSEIGKFTLFNDSSFTDKDYHKKYPTINHLIKALIENKDEKFDIRLVYLAVANIISNRGHFLFEGQDFDSEYSFSYVFDEMNKMLFDEFEFSLDNELSDEIGEILKKKGILNKKKQLIKIFGKDNAQMQAVIEMLCGASVFLSKLFLFVSKEDDIKISFNTDSYENEYENIEKILQEKIIILEKIKAVYDWSVLSDILNGEKYISFSKVNVYEKHKKDLCILKRIVKKYGTAELYNDIFNNTEKPDNYVAYIGMVKQNNKKQPVNKSKCIQEDLCKFLSKAVSKMPDDDIDVQYIKAELSTSTLLPKQKNKDNGVIPYQIRQKELNAILKNAENYLPFLKTIDETNLSNSEKIVKIMTFKIPYYVGPLNDANKESGNCWIVKRNLEKILPWNFEENVDLEASAEKFIKRMTNKCTYLIGADVIPKNSLLYSKFTVLNELNNLKINGENICVELKQNIFKDLFLNKSKVTKKSVTDYIKQNYGNEPIELSGIDGDFKSSMKSYLDFRKIFTDTKISNDEIEEIIQTLVLFCDDKKLLKKRISSICPKISEEELKKVIKLKYSGWGRLSKEFLTSVIGTKKDTGECFNIINALWETNDNLMQLLSENYTFLEEIEKCNAEINDVDDSFSYDNLVKNLYVSPSVKRSIWQTLRVVKEICKITGHNPKKVFVEVTRSDEEKGEKGRKISRRNNLIELYKKCKDEERNWAEELDMLTDDELRRDRLYLYYTQMGKCMYSGENIDINSLYDTNVYDIDHIYPQSITKDDSINNRVLVLKPLNAKKSNIYPIPNEMHQVNLWNNLYKKGLISKSKYERLMRKDKFSNAELGGFIARQLVETSQATKAVAEILKKILNTCDTEIVYAKAKNVSEFRKGVSCFKDEENPKDNAFVKVREINDFHHAKDAYLNIVVGNVYNTKFTHSPASYINSNPQIKYNLNRMYEFDVIRNNTVAWQCGKDKTMQTVKNVMKRNDVLFTRYSFENKGGLFDQQPVKKKENLMPLKGNNPILADTAKYGGYNKISGAYFCLVEHTDKNKTVRTIEYIPVYLSKIIENDKDAELEYLIKSLNLENPKILISKIKINTLFSVDGFLMHLSGRTGKQLVFKNACQLIMPEDLTIYFKKIVKFEEKCIAKKQTLNVSKFDKLTKEENNLIYKFFMDKLEHSIYNKVLSSQIKTFKNGEETFINLSLAEQCRFLYKAISLFQCNPQSSDLSLIKGPGKAGILVMSKNITGLNNIKLIHQSQTGLFEKIIDLKLL